MTTSTDSVGATAPALIAGAPWPILLPLTPLPSPPLYSAPSETRSSRLPSRNRYLAVAATRRFRAVQRRRVLKAARLGLSIIGGVALANCATLVAIHPHAAGTLLATNGSLLGLALTGHLVLRRRGGRCAPGVVFVAGVGVVMAAILLALIEPELTILSAGYLLLTPVAVAMIVPWRTRIHTLWLLLVSASSLVFIIVAPESALEPPQRLDLAVLIIAAAAVSHAGHSLSLRVDVASHVQLERINHLRGSEAEHLKALARLNRALALSARTDELTSLGNRLRLMEDLQTLRGRIDRNEELCAVLMVDLDRFKKVNDRRGHLVGDDVLRTVAAVVLRSLRIDDGAYRYGGEEFVAFARVHSGREAMLVAERIRAEVEGLAIPHPDNPPHDFVTVSIGVTVIGRADLIDTADAWIGRADAALYRAKASGRNGSEFIPSPHPAGPSRLIGPDGREMAAAPA